VNTISNFIQNPQGDQIVNIDNVTSIMFEGNKVIFNMNYGISLNNNIDHIIQDYVYFYYNNEENTREIKSLLQHYGWFTFGASDNRNRWVNPKSISFVKFEVRIKNNKTKYRIIVNLNSSVSLNSDIFARTSDAVYYDFSKEEDFETAKLVLDNYLEPSKI
jgi:hypothetical protein